MAEKVCEPLFYNMDPQVVQTELEEFRHAYRAVQDILLLHDLIPDDRKRGPIRLDEAGTISDDEDEQKTQLSTELHGDWELLF